MALLPFSQLFSISVHPVACKHLKYKYVCPKLDSHLPCPFNQPQAYFFHTLPSALSISNVEIILHFSFTTQSQALWILHVLKLPMAVTPFKPAASFLSPCFHCVSKGDLLGAVSMSFLSHLYFVQVPARTAST